MHKVEWEKEALDDLQKIDKPILKRILNKISWFSQHFDNTTPEPLSGDFDLTPFIVPLRSWVSSID